MEVGADDAEELRQIMAADPNASLVNSYYENLGDTEVMNMASLAEYIRWQYECCHPLVERWELKEVS